VTHLRWKGVGESRRASKREPPPSAEEVAAAPARHFLAARCCAASFAEAVIDADVLVAAYSEFCETHNVPATRQEPLLSSNALREFGGVTSDCHPARWVKGVCEMVAAERAFTGAAARAASDGRTETSLKFPFENCPLARLETGALLECEVTEDHAAAADDECAASAAEGPLKAAAHAAYTIGSVAAKCVTDPSWAWQCVADGAAAVARHANTAGNWPHEMGVLLSQILVLTVIPVPSLGLVYWVAGCESLDKIGWDIELKPLCNLRSLTWWLARGGGSAFDLAKKLLLALALVYWATAILECLAYYSTMAPHTPLGARSAKAFAAARAARRELAQELERKVKERQRKKERGTAVTAAATDEPTAVAEQKATIEANAKAKAKATQQQARVLAGAPLSDEQPGLLMNFTEHTEARVELTWPRVILRCVCARAPRGGSLRLRGSVRWRRPCPSLRLTAPPIRFKNNGPQIHIPVDDVCVPLELFWRHLDARWRLVLYRRLVRRVMEANEWRRAILSDCAQPLPASAHKCFCCCVLTVLLPPPRPAYHLVPCESDHQSWEVFDVRSRRLHVLRVHHRAAGATQGHIRGRQTKDRGGSDDVHSQGDRRQVARGA
jgi:hypothetical protein